MCENEQHGIPEVESCINILEVKGHEQCVNMSCMKRQNDNMDQVKRQLFIDEAYLKTSA